MTEHSVDSQLAFTFQKAQQSHRSLQADPGDSSTSSSSNTVRIWTKTCLHLSKRLTFKERLSELMREITDAAASHGEQHFEWINPIHSELHCPRDCPQNHVDQNDGWRDRCRTSGVASLAAYSSTVRWQWGTITSVSCHYPHKGRPSPAGPQHGSISSPPPPSPGLEQTAVISPQVHHVQFMQTYSTTGWQVESRSSSRCMVSSTALFSQGFMVYQAHYTS